MANFPPPNQSPLFYSVDQYIDVRIIEGTNETMIGNGVSS